MPKARDSRLRLQGVLLARRHVPVCFRVARQAYRLRIVLWRDESAECATSMRHELVMESRRWCSWSSFHPLRDTITSYQGRRLSNMFVSALCRHVVIQLCTIFLLSHTAISVIGNKRWQYSATNQVTPRKSAFSTILKNPSLITVTALFTLIVIGANVQLLLLFRWRLLHFWRSRDMCLANQA